MSLGCVSNSSRDLSRKTHHEIFALGHGVGGNDDALERLGSRERLDSDQVRRGVAAVRQGLPWRGRRAPQAGGRGRAAARGQRAPQRRREGRPAQVHLAPVSAHRRLLDGDDGGGDHPRKRQPRARGAICRGELYHRAFAAGAAAAAAGAPALRFPLTPLISILPPCLRFLPPLGTWPHRHRGSIEHRLPSFLPFFPKTTTTRWA